MAEWRAASCTVADASSSSSPSGVEPIVLEPSTSADEPLLLSTRLPTAEELELLLYEASERAKVDDHSL